MMDLARLAQQSAALRSHHLTVLRREVAKGKDSLGAHNLNEGTSRRCVSNTNGVFKTM